MNTLKEDQEALQKIRTATFKKKPRIDGTILDVLFIGFGLAAALYIVPRILIYFNLPA